MVLARVGRWRDPHLSTRLRYSCPIDKVAVPRWLAVHFYFFGRIVPVCIVRPMHDEKIM